MTVNFVFDKFDPISNTPTSNLIGSYYYKDRSQVPYWFEWGGDVNKHLLKDNAWITDENAVIKCVLTSESWDLHARCEVLVDIPYLVTVDIKLGTADNCNVSIIDSDSWKPLGGVSFNPVDHQLSQSEWSTVIVEMQPSTTGVIHLHIGALNNELTKQQPGTVFIKNLRVKSSTTNMLVTAFSQQNGKYRIVENVKQHPNCISLSEINKYENDCNIYPIVITTAEYFYCWPLLLLGKNIVDLVNENKLKILFLCSFEPIRESFLTIHHHIVRICSLQKIKKLDNIIFASSDSTIEQRVVEYKKEILNTDKTASLVKFKDINGYGYITPKILKSANNNDWLEIYCNNYEKSYTFLYLNNRITFHRYLCYKYIEYKDLLQYGMYSWNGYVSTNTPTVDLVSEFKSQFCQPTVENRQHQKFVDYVVSNTSIPVTKIANDSAVLLFNPLVEGSQVDPNWIANTYFSVVTETHVGDDPSHITEKIYKLIFCCHPFIVVGPRHHLATLRRYGFKTFSCLFDESYDLMPETLEKYNLISDQIKFYTTDEGREKLKQLLPVLRSTLEYNRNHLLSLSSNDVWNSLEKLYSDN
jgi:hypothetical protein